MNFHKDEVHFEKLHFLSVPKDAFVEEGTFNWQLLLLLYYLENVFKKLVILFFSFCIMRLGSHETPPGNYHDSITCQLPGSVTTLYPCCMHFLLSQNNFVDVWAVFKDAAAALLQRFSRRGGWNSENLWKERTEEKKKNRKTFRLTFGDRHCEITALAFQLSQIIFRTEMTNCKRELQFPPLIIYFSYIITQSLKKEKRMKCIVNFLPFFCKT